MTINFTSEEINSITKEINPKCFNLIDHIVIFVGHAHSGHSIIGAMLDSHPDTAIANELNIPKVIKHHKLSERQIYSLIINQSKDISKKDGWRNSEYKYNFKSTGQSKNIKPKVIGDKKAGGSTRIFYNHFWVFEHLLDIFGEKLKLVFVNRNARDIVAAYSYYMKQEPSQFHIDRYIENYNTTMKLKSTLPPNQWLTINQKDFIDKPGVILSKLFRFFNLSEEKDYIQYLSSFVRKDIKGKSETIHIPPLLSDQLQNFK